MNFGFEPYLEILYLWLILNIVQLSFDSACFVSGLIAVFGLAGVMALAEFGLPSSGAVALIIGILSAVSYLSAWVPSIPSYPSCISS